MILIEGLPGCGKTTMAAKVCLSLRQDGVMAEWWREEDQKHPVTPRALKRSAAQPGFAERCLKAWAEMIGDGDRCPATCVLEGTIFQSTLRFMLEYGMERKEMLEYVSRLDEVLAPVAPGLVYLYAREPEAFLVESVLPERGEEWVSRVSSYLEGTPFCRGRGWTGERGMVRFWVYYRELCEEALERLTLPAVRVLVGPEHWARAERAICRWARAHLKRREPGAGVGPAG